MVCSRCASIKQGCSGGFPCERCIRLRLPCYSKSRSDSSTQSTDSGLGYLAQPQPKARIRRVHTGCLTCKQRKKKCDEAKPSCGDCRRLCLQCSWPTGRSDSVVVCNSWSSDLWLPGRVSSRPRHRRPTLSTVGTHHNRPLDRRHNSGPVRGSLRDPVARPVMDRHSSAELLCSSSAFTLHVVSQSGGRPLSQSVCAQLDP
jgi:hypothetical protein